jgi:hypothetical protein
MKTIKEPSDKSKIRNPLDPIYYLGFINGDKETHGPIEGNKPSVFSKYHYQPPFNLRNDDILGSNPGSKNYMNKFNGMNYIYTSQDIIGAQPSTLRRGIETKRRVNPLRPKYNYLGAEEIKQNIDRYKDLRRSGANTTIGGKRSELLNPNIKIKDNNNDRKTPLSDTNLYQTVNNSVRNSGTAFGKNETFDFSKLPFVQDTVDFDKDKYKKPNPFYGYLHDQYIIPPIEKHKKKEIQVNPNLRSFQETVREKATRNLPLL